MGYDPFDPYDSTHVGSFGFVWFKHKWELETDPDTGLTRAYCACGWVGAWRHHEAVADQDGERHPVTADYAWNQEHPRPEDEVEPSPGAKTMALVVFAIVVTIVTLYFVLVYY